MKFIKKILLSGLISMIGFGSLYAVDKNDTFVNQQRIDSFVDKIVEEKDEQLINQAQFDKEYLAYLRSKRAAKNKKPEDAKTEVNTAINGFTTFNMQK